MRTYSDPAADGKPEVLPVDSIEPNPDQPRRTFDADELRELAASINERGLIQAITVRPMGQGRFQIVAGERRWRAHKLLCRETIPAIVRQMTDAERDILAIIENLQRVDVPPLEEGRSFGRLVDQGLTVAEIAKRTGATERKISDRLRLCGLEPSIQKLLAAGQIGQPHANEIARLPEQHKQLRVLRALNSGKLAGWHSVRAAVDAELGLGASPDMFGSAAPTPTGEEVKTLRLMEDRVDAILRMVNAGWKDGECIVANRVNPDRASKVAEKLKLIRGAIRTMEQQLRHTSAQAAMSLQSEDHDNANGDGHDTSN